jgi:hypothetical protein
MTDPNDEAKAPVAPMLPSSPSMCCTSAFCIMSNNEMQHDFFNQLEL